MYKTINASQVRQGERVVTGAGTVSVLAVKVVSGIIDLTVRHPRNGKVHLSFRPDERVSVKE